MCQFFPKVLFQALQGNSLWYPCQSKGTLAAAVSQRGTSAARPAWECLSPIPALPPAASSHSCCSATCCWGCAVKQVAELVQVTNNLFYLQACFSYRLLFLPDRCQQPQCWRSWGGRALEQSGEKSSEDSGHWGGSMPGCPELPAQRVSLPLIRVECSQKGVTITH